eukprot:10753737-Lingulodinium_polyedra.AAC.1
MAPPQTRPRWPTRAEASLAARRDLQRTHGPCGQPQFRRCVDASSAPARPQRASRVGAPTP